MRYSHSVHFLFLLTLSAALVTACGDTEGNFAGVDLPGIRVIPTVVTFSQISIGESEVQTVQVENTGGAELIVASHRWTGNASDFRVADLDGLRVPVGEGRTFTIIYEPTDEAFDDARLVLESNGGEAVVTVQSLGQASLLRTEPAEIELISDEVGLPVAQDVKILNAGTQSFTISGASLITGSGDFRMVALDFELPVTLGVAENITLQLIYTPSNFGSDEANLLLEHDASNAVDGASVIPVLGALRTPQISVTPAFIEFGAVAMDDTKIEVATVTNTGQTNLDLRDIYTSFDTSEDFAIVSVDGVDYVPDAFELIELEPDTSVEVEVAYTPSDGGPDSGKVVFFTNDPEFSIFEVPMGGRLDAPFLSVSPGALGFGNVAGGLHRDMGVVVRNAGTGELQLDDPVITSGVDFTLVNAHLYPDTLAADEAFELVVRFSPTAEGSLTDVLTIASPNDPLNSPVEVNLGAFGAGEAECVLTPIPSTINFGLVPRGSRQIARGAVRNTGSGNCRVDRVFLQPTLGGLGGLFGDLFSDAFSVVSVSSATPFTMGPGDHFLIEAAYAPITFTATSETLGDTASVQIDAVDPVDGSEVECGSISLFSGFGGFGSFNRACGVNLQARSGVAAISAIPSTVDFGLVTRGCNSQEISVNVYNTGSAPVTVSGIGLESCTSEFRLAGVPPEVSSPDGLELPSGGSPLTLRVRYSPAGLFASSCELVIAHNAAGGRLVVPMTGEGTNLSEQTDHFEQLTGRKVDVLFVVDNSGSMSEEQTNLRDNFADFIRAAQTWGTDFQIGVVTTESDDEFRGRQPGELVGSPRILIPSTTSLAAAFSSNADVGDSGDGARESGLESAHLALIDPNISDVAECGADCVEPYACVPNATGSESRCGGYNRSFLREDASLELVFLSDENDQSRASVEFYVDFFQSIKGARNRALFHANAIVGPRGGCDGTGGTADSGSRYLDVADATDGVSSSICDDNFATSLENIGNRAFGLQVQFFLSRMAEEGGITVTDDGGREIRGWTFDRESNAIVFTEDTAPRPGQGFDVSYTAACF